MALNFHILLTAAPLTFQFPCKEILYPLINNIVKRYKQKLNTITS